VEHEVETRAEGRCGYGAMADLRLRGRDGVIEVRFALTHPRAAGAWRLVLIRERRVAWRGTTSVGKGSGRLEVRRTLADLDGVDVITMQAWGPRGVTCRATAPLADV
jgi:hypothetical protein